MVNNPLWEICERVAEVQALLDDHLAGASNSDSDTAACAFATTSAAVYSALLPAEHAAGRHRFNIIQSLLLPRRAGGIFNHVRTPNGVWWRDLIVRRLLWNTVVKQQTRPGNQKSGSNNCSLCNREWLESIDHAATPLFYITIQSTYPTNRAAFC